MKFSTKFMFLVILLTAGIPILFSRGFRPAQIPNGTINNCANCHVNPAGGGARNAFGQTVEQSFLDQGNVVWGADLAMIDSDGDGFTNGQELQDPFGLWSTGQASPGNAAYVSNPGDASSVPPAEAQLASVNLHLTAMDPHVGQMMEFGIVDVASNTLVASQKLAALTKNDTNIVFLNVLEAGKSYHLDFYADLNGNGQYDPPPADHAWRISIDNASKDTTIEFTHNTNFTDIRGPLDIDDPTAVADDFVLEQNYPNPFNPVTTISFSVPSTQYVILEIYNASGQKVKTLVRGQYGSGKYTVQWNATDENGKIVPSGTYFYQLRTREKILIKRMTFIK